MGMRVVLAPSGDSGQVLMRYGPLWRQAPQCSRTPIDFSLARPRVPPTVSRLPAAIERMNVYRAPILMPGGIDDAESNRQPYFYLDLDVKLRWEPSPLRILQ